MKKRRGRKPKLPEQTRDLTKAEIEALGILWRWKVMPASLLKEMAFQAMGRHRFRVHAPAHDYLATALHLGGVLYSTDSEIGLYSEQQIQTSVPEFLPQGYQYNYLSFDEKFGGSRNHVPDGLTVVQNQKGRVVIGYEAEINLKPVERYGALFKYWHNSNGSEEYFADVVFITVRTPWIAGKIISYAKSHGEKNRIDQRPLLS